MSVKPSYYSYLTSAVRYDKRLKPSAKLLYSEITALSSQYGFCWATNRYFADLFEVRTETVSLWINSLVKLEYIESKIIYKEGTKQILNRYLEIKGSGIVKDINIPIDIYLKDNKKIINNKSNIFFKEKSNNSREKFLE